MLHGEEGGEWGVGRGILNNFIPIFTLHVRDQSWVLGFTTNKLGQLSYTSL